MMFRLLVFYTILTSSIMIGVVLADYEIISKKPNYLKRGPGYSEAKIANYLKKELRKANYTIIKLSLIHI